jgi:hypothetical protein
VNQPPLLELSVVRKEAYNTGTLQLLYHLTDNHFILLHVEFGDVLSISVLKNRATRIKILKFLKKVEDIQRPPDHFILNPVLSKLLVSRLGTPVHVKVFKMTGTYSKEKSHGDGFK